jgi:hypothetical protein
MRFRLPARALLGTLLAVSAAALPGATLVPASADFGPSCVGVVRGVQPDGTGTTSTVRRMEFNAETGEVIVRSVDYALPYQPVLMAYGPWKTAFAVTSDGKLHHLHTSLTGGPTLDRVVGTGWGSTRQIFVGSDTLYAVTSTGALRAYTVTDMQLDTLTVSNGRQISASGWGGVGAMTYEHAATGTPPTGYTYSDGFIATIPATGELVRYFINDGTQYSGPTGFKRVTLRASTWGSMRAVIPVDCFDTSGQWKPNRYYVAHHATSGALYRYSAPAIPTSTSSTMSGLGVWTAGGVWQMPFVGGYS